MCKYCDHPSTKTSLFWYDETSEGDKIHLFADGVLWDTKDCSEVGNLNFIYCPICGRSLKKVVTMGNDPLPKPQEDYKLIAVASGTEDEVTSWEAAIAEAKAMIEQDGADYVEVYQLVGKLHSVRQAVWE